MILMISVSFGTTVYLKKGGTVEGEVISKDDEKFVIKTAEEEKTLKWRQLKNKSIEEINPVLYETLKKQAIERQKNKKEVGKSQKINKKEIDFSRIHLGVETTEKRGTFKKVDNGIDELRGKEKRKLKHQTLTKRDCNGKIVIKISGLEPNEKYTLKTVYSHYIISYGDKNPKQDVTQNNISNVSSLYGKRNYEIIINTSKYSQYKNKIKSGHGYHFTSGNRKMHEYGKKAKGWDVSIWLNDVLIYEHKKGKDKVFYKNILH